MRAPLAPLSSLLRWKPASASSACSPTSAAKAGIAAASPASSLAKASEYCAVVGPWNAAADKFLGTRICVSAKVADRPSPKLFRGIGDRGADATAGAEKLVGGLKPRRGVDGVAIGGVIEEAAAAEIADPRRTGVNADAGCAEIHAFGLPALAKRLGPAIEVMRAGNGAGGIIRLVAGGVEQNLDRVAHDLRDGAFVCKDNIGHPAHIFVEQRAKHFRRGRL